MDDASCKAAVAAKDACESYAECYTSKQQAYNALVKLVKQEEIDRKGEWKGLKRMQCLITAFSDGKVVWCCGSIPWPGYPICPVEFDCRCFDSTRIVICGIMKTPMASHRCALVYPAGLPQRVGGKHNDVIRNIQ